MATSGEEPRRLIEMRRKIAELDKVNELERQRLEEEQREVEERRRQQEEFEREFRSAQRERWRSIEPVRLKLNMNVFFASRSNNVSIRREVAAERSSSRRSSSGQSAWRSNAGKDVQKPHS
jgi:hypothetical protein